MQKLTYASNEEKEKVLSSIGCEGYNHAPSNIRIATAGNIMSSRFTGFSPKYIFHNQVLPHNLPQDLLDARYEKVMAEGQKKYLRKKRSYMETCAMIQFMVYHDNTGIGIEHFFWEEVLIWYTFGCDHKYRELSQDECRKLKISHFGRCYHVQKCETCGHVQANSSDD